MGWQQLVTNGTMAKTLPYIQTLRSTQQMSEAMRGATKAMASMNRRMNLPQIQKIMMDFERESEFMDMKEEMMNDAIDDAVEEEDDEAETNEIVERVLDEIGIDMNQQVTCFVRMISKHWGSFYSCGPCTNSSWIHLLV